jgi:hypothetical protein
MKRRSPDWVGLACALLSIRDGLRPHLPTLQALAGAHPGAADAVAAVVAAVETARKALKQRRRR